MEGQNPSPCSTVFLSLQHRAGFWQRGWMLLKNQFQLCSLARERSQAEIKLPFTIFILIRIKKKKTNKQWKRGVPLYPHTLVTIVITRNAVTSTPVGIYCYLEGFVWPDWCRCVSPISPAQTSLTQLVCTLSFGWHCPVGLSSISTKLPKWIMFDLWWPWSFSHVFNSFMPLSNPSLHFNKSSYSPKRIHFMLLSDTVIY